MNDEAIMAPPAARTGDGSEIYWLSSEMVEEILSRVDGTTLATAACVCNEFGRIARHEALWEDACRRSLCPSTALDLRLHHFVSSAFGGFRKFYAHSFPFILHKFYDDDSCHSLHGSDCAPSPSDFVSIVDVQYGQKSIYSNVLWGIPDADDLHGWFSNCPFRIDLLSLSSDGEEDAESPANSPAVAIDADGLPSVPVSCTEEEGRKEKFWRAEMTENMRLSWIVVDRRSRRAMNVSSWRPLGLQRQLWDSNSDFVIRFGSILPPARHDISGSGAVQCTIVMKCRISGFEGESRKLKINELGLQLEDMAGGHVNGKNSLLILERALGCRRTTKHSEVLECYHRFLKARSDLNEEKMRREGRFDTICLLTGIALFAIFCYVMIH